MEILAKYVGGLGLGGKMGREGRGSVVGCGMVGWGAAGVWGEGGWGVVFWA